MVPKASSSYVESIVILTLLGAIFRQVSWMVINQAIEQTFNMLLQ